VGERSEERGGGWKKKKGEEKKINGQKISVGKGEHQKKASKRLVLRKTKEYLKAKQHQKKGKGLTITLGGGKYGRK